MNQDVSLTIMHERLDFAIGLVQEMCKEHKLNLTDAEIMEHARTIAISLYIQRERYNERKR